MLPDRILVVDDDPSWQELLAESIEAAEPARGEHTLTVARSFDEADALLDRRHFHLAFVDLRLKEDARDFDGKRIAKKIVDQDEGTSVVIATGHADVSTAITALKEWQVLDFVLKDEWDPGKVARLVQTGIPVARERYRLRYESALDILRGGQDIQGWLAEVLRCMAPETAVARPDRRLAGLPQRLARRDVPTPPRAGQAGRRDRTDHRRCHGPLLEQGPGPAHRRLLRPDGCTPG
jgi:CheY-like chemotaxis protein